MCFKIHNINFEVDYLFYSILIIYLAFDRTGIYLPLLISVILHEFSHIICLVVFNCKVYSVKLNFGAVTIKYNECISKTKKIISTLMGPLSNLILSFVGLIHYNEILFYINLIIAIYNLLPINGLDGGDILKTSLSGVLSEKVIENILNTITIIIVATIIMICLILKILTVYVSLFCVYLISPLILKNLLKHCKN